MQISLDASQNSFGVAYPPSQDTLLAAVKDSIQTNAPAGAPALSSDQLNAMATDLVTRKPGAGGGHHHHHHGGGATSAVQMPDSSLLSALSSTSSTDGTSSTDATLTQLLQNLQSTGNSSGTSRSSFQQVMEQLNDSSPSYSSDGSTPAKSGSLGLNAFA